MSTPDTSSDDATLAAFETSIPTFHGSTSLDRKVVAIARRLQGELKDANDDADSLAREKQHHEDMRRQAEAEVRELRATVAELRADTTYSCGFCGKQRVRDGAPCKCIADATTEDET